MKIIRRMPIILNMLTENEDCIQLKNRQKKSICVHIPF